MRHLLEEGRKGLGEPVTVDDRWIVQVYEARGFLASPVRGRHLPQGERAGLAQERRRQGKIGRLLYSELSLHLMEKYHFLEGHGSSFRLDPHDIKTCHLSRDS